MKLAAMRYKDYIWPHNPRTYTIDYERKMAVHKIPFGLYTLQDLGQNRRVMKGEGEFVGAGAYEEFRKLATVFYSGGAGTLVHPIWQAAEAYFVELQLKQEPQADYVRYSFTFWEAASALGTLVKQKAQTTVGGAESVVIAGGEARYHTVKQGESLWAIARLYGTALSDVVAMNRQIKNPNLIHPGERVRVK